jgi:hypothetical protein
VTVCWSLFFDSSKSQILESSRDFLSKQDEKVIEKVGIRKMLAEGSFIFKAYTCYLMSFCVAISALLIQLVDVLAQQYLEVNLKFGNDPL